MVSRVSHFFTFGRTTIISIIFLYLSIPRILGQNDTFGYFYRIYFKDKGENHLNDFTLSELFSQRAIERRERQGISGPDSMDIPVFKGYLDMVSAMGLKLHCKSRWMNTAVFKSPQEADLNSILTLPFVKDVKIVRHPVTKGVHKDKFESELKDDANPYDNAIPMVNGEYVHYSGFKGMGKLIAVLDGGFTDFDRVPAFEKLRDREDGVTGTYDFVKNDSFVYDYHVHGSDVMCILAGDVEGQITGSATDASYLLLRTEDTFSEFPVEEDYWAAGAEYADSAGCDIISSSLGYYQFDDPTMDYKFSDMDGNTAFVTLAARAAISRGIVVVNSAGNERGTAWDHIIAPSDGENVICVGAVDWRSVIAAFSSPGPSSDGRIKPDIDAQGVYMTVQVIGITDQMTELPEIIAVSGTSFSCPLISGMLACLMQAVPEAKASDIVSVIRAASDRFDSPDNDYGYGIPDMVKAVTLLQKKYVHSPSNVLSLGPNPFSDHINIIFRENPEWLEIEVFEGSGRTVFKRSYQYYISLTYLLDELQSLRDGLYFIRLTTSRGSFSYKVIKVGKQ
jgi:serine protease AprX